MLTDFCVSSTPIHCILHVHVELDISISCISSLQAFPSVCAWLHMETILSAVQNV